MRYVAYAVDLSGVARGVHEIDSPTDEDAKKRAEKFLEAHPAVEMWAGPRRVARLVREISDWSRRPIVSWMDEAQPPVRAGSCRGDRAERRGRRPQVLFQIGAC